VTVITRWLIRVLPTNRDNAITICDYVTSKIYEVNLSNNYRNLVVLSLCRFSLFFKNAISFKDITRDDLLAHLDHFRKSESVDPLHKWIGAYNIDRINLARFFKWLYAPDIPPETRPKPHRLSAKRRQFTSLLICGVLKTMHYF
jgi:hypothetical protein